jgi:hypothetical protein
MLRAGNAPLVSDPAHPRKNGRSVPASLRATADIVPDPAKEKKCPMAVAGSGLIERRALLFIDAVRNFPGH